MDLNDLDLTLNAGSADWQSSADDSETSSWLRIALYLLVAVASAFLVVWVALTVQGSTSLIVHLSMFMPLGAVGLAAYLVWRARDTFSNETEELESAAQKARAEARAAEKLLQIYHHVLREGEIGVYRATLDGKLLSANQPLAALLGFGSIEALRQHYSVRPFPAGDERKSILQAVQAVGEIKSHESDWLRSDDTSVSVNETARVIRDEAGRAVGIEGFVISAANADAAPSPAPESGSVAGQERGDDVFLAHMSHELRTPINAIIGMTSLLADTQLDAEQRDFVDTVRVSSESLLSITNNVLDFSKIEAESLELERRPFSLRGCIEDALDLVALRASEKRLELLYAIEAQTPATLIGDDSRLRQILVNLLSNAVKFTDEGEVTVSVRAKQIHGANYEYHFAVTDTGMGIPEDKQKSLFKPYYQTEVTTSRKFGGTGLGLAISKLLSERMGGSMSVESTPGVGSAFHFTIQAEITGEAETSPYQEVLPRLDGKRVLLLDDNNLSRSLTGALLEGLRMHTTTSGSVEEAMGYLRDPGAFDLAVVSLTHFGQDSVVFARRVRQFDSDHPTPMVLVRSLTAPAVYDRPFRTAFLQKPMKRDRLIMALLKGLNLTDGVPDNLSQGDGAIQPTSEPLSVLVAEDDPVNQKVMLRLLERLGHHADVVGTGEAALDTLVHTHYDAVILDVRMPGLSGPETAQEIVNRFPAKATRPQIIGMTASTAISEREKCLAAGMDTCLTKPIHLEELVRELKTLRALQPRNSGGDRPTDGDVRSSLRRLMHSAHGDEPAFMAELLTSFIRTAPTLLSALEDQLGRDDVTGVKRSARTFKSSCQFIGLMRLAALCKALEVAATTATSRSELEPFVRTISAEFSQIQPVLAEERDFMLSKSEQPASEN